MKTNLIPVSFALGSAFALSLSSLPVTAIAATAGNANLQPVAMMSGNAHKEGNCSQMMGSQKMSKGYQEGNCSKNMNKMAKKSSKAQEGHCTSSAAIKAHDGKCGKTTMEKMHQSKMTS
ncbi:hypothetical protein B1757_07010 [Acidithiobacillus marinus]|uniref:Phosphate starvation-inducible protein PsiF n=1 Tax=Acidithiobacillus marinus TaxID=187490 RepID=A0A2I1DM57_9PROT|nr:hypothetical protein [Acidithiobacillus marinus]PKY10960.1 hypothetical protein B1757_07010 [Acidithiobacillus marinus]